MDPVKKGVEVAMRPRQETYGMSPEDELNVLNNILNELQRACMVMPAGPEKDTVKMKLSELEGEIEGKSQTLRAGKIADKTALEVSAKQNELKHMQRAIMSMSAGPEKEAAKRQMEALEDEIDGKAKEVRDVKLAQLATEAAEAAAHATRVGTERAMRRRKETYGMSPEDELNVLNTDLNEMQRALLGMPAGPEKDIVKKKLRELEDEIEGKAEAARAGSIAEQVAKEVDEKNAQLNEMQRSMLSSPAGPEKDAMKQKLNALEAEVEIQAASVRASKIAKSQADAAAKNAFANRAGTERAMRPRKETYDMSPEDELSVLNNDTKEIQRAYMVMSAGPEKDAVKKKLTELEDEIESKASATRTANMKEKHEKELIRVGTERAMRRRKETYDMTPEDELNVLNTDLNEMQRAMLGMPAGPEKDIVKKKLRALEDEIEGKAEAARAESVVKQEAAAAAAVEEATRATEAAAAAAVKEAARQKEIEAQMQQEAAEAAAHATRVGTERAMRRRKKTFGISPEDELDVLNTDLNEIQRAMLGMPAGPEKDIVKKKLRALEDEIEGKAEAARAESVVKQEAAAAAAVEEEARMQQEAAKKAAHATRVGTERAMRRRKETYGMSPVDVLSALNTDMKEIQRAYMVMPAGPEKDTVKMKLSELEDEIEGKSQTVRAGKIADKTALEVSAKQNELKHIQLAFMSMSAGPEKEAAKRQMEALEDEIDGKAKEVRDVKLAQLATEAAEAAAHATRVANRKVEYELDEPQSMPVFASQGMTASPASIEKEQAYAARAKEAQLAAQISSEALAAVEAQRTALAELPPSPEKDVAELKLKEAESKAAEATEKSRELGDLKAVKEEFQREMMQDIEQGAEMASDNSYQKAQLREMCDRVARMNTKLRKQMDSRKKSLDRFPFKTLAAHSGLKSLCVAVGGLGLISLKMVMSLAQMGVSDVLLFDLNESDSNLGSMANLTKLKEAILGMHPSANVKILSTDDVEDCLNHLEDAGLVITSTSSKSNVVEDMCKEVGIPWIRTDVNMSTGNVSYQFFCEGLAPVIDRDVVANRCTNWQGATPMDTTVHAISTGATAMMAGMAAQSVVKYWIGQSDAVVGYAWFSPVLGKLSSMRLADLQR